MPGQSAIRGAGRRRAGSGIMRGVAFVLVISTVAALGVAMTDGRAALATVLAADAASYVPSLSNLPPGYREEAVDAVGGDLEPTISLRSSSWTAAAAWSWTCRSAARFRTPTPCWAHV